MIITHNTGRYFHSALTKHFFKDFPPNLHQLFKSLAVIKIIRKGEKVRLKTQSLNNIPIPYACILSVTWKCNLKCVGCYAQNYPTENQLNNNEIKSVLSQAALMGIYIFIVVGGEPLLIPGLVELLASAKNSLFFLFTNGILLEEGKLEKLKKAKNIIPIISTEGNSTFIDQRRGIGMGRTVGNALALLKKYKILFGFSAMVTHKNVREVLSRTWMDSLWEYGAKFGFIIDYIPFPKTLDKSLLLDQEDLKFKREEIRELNTHSKLILFNFPEDEYLKPGCKSAGNGFIHINANGNVEPCPFSHYAADNIREKSLLDILDSDFFRKLRETFQTKENPYNSCMLFYNDHLVKEIAGETNAIYTEKILDNN